MSTARFGRKWADVDEDDEETTVAGGAKDGAGATRFETAADENGVKMVIEYTERDGRTYKITKRMQQTVVHSWTNRSIQERKELKKFGKAATAEEAAQKFLVVKSEEEVPLELSRKQLQQVNVRDEEEEKFYKESLAIMEGLVKEKKVWTDLNRARQEERDEKEGVKPDAEKEKEAEKPAELAKSTDGKPAYLPPSLRNGGGGKGDGKGGKGGMDAQQEASLRITNLSEDCREGDLQDLFGQFGRLQRVYLAKDQETFQSRGFAFVTYYTREDAQRAINKLHGHGYDNLILQVQFAKPRA